MPTRITGALRRVRNKPSTLEVRTVQAEVQARLFARRDDGPKLGRYRLTRQLGAGGLGVVYEAHDPNLDRIVAVKLMRQREWLTDDDLERFVREAAAMARVSDPHVVAVFDVGRYDHRDLALDGETLSEDIPPVGVFIVMERVDGEDLHAWLRAPRAPREILRTFEEAGRGLAAAHAVGIVHRDFKPQNVMVTAQGAKVLDFGLARLVGIGTEDQEIDASFDDMSGDALASPLTRPGIVMGTPAYMAPEQHAGKIVDARADQYAFCVALAEALLGRRLFTGTTMEALHEHKMALELPRSPAIPRAARAALVRGLKARPEDRWPTMDALLAALRPKRRVRGLAVLVGSAMLAAAGLAIVEARDATASSATADDAPEAPAFGAPEDPPDEFRREDITEHDRLVGELIGEGRDQEVVALAESLRAEAKDDPLLFAWTGYWAAHGYMRLEDYPAACAAAESAYETALRIGHTMLAAKSAMVAAESYSRDHDPTALLWQRHAVAMVERGDLSPHHAAYVLDGVGSVLAGFDQDPSEMQLRAIALREEGDGPDAPALVPMMHNYIRTLVNQERGAEGEPIARRMLSIAQPLPEDRIERVMAEQNLGDVLCLSGRMEEGLPWLDASIERLEAHFMEVYPVGLGLSLKMKARCLADLGRFGDAIAAQRRALELTRNMAVRNHGIELRHLVTIARWQVEAGDVEAAKGTYREALGVVDPDEAEPKLRIEARQELAELEDPAAESEHVAVDPELEEEVGR